QQSRCRFEHPWYDVYQGRNRRAVAVYAARQHRYDGWIAGDLDRVAGIFGVQVHLQIQRQPFATLRSGFGPVVNAAGEAFFDGEKLGANVASGEHRLAGLGNLAEMPSESMHDERERFNESDVAH